MTTIDSRRHFIFLVCAVLLLPALVEPAVRPVPDLFVRMYVYFGLVGLLNALTWVLALRGSAPAMRQVAFVAVATALSTAALPAGVGVVTTILPSRDDLLFLAMLTASAGGAAAYWLAVRWFWLQRLAWSSLALSVVACVVATGSAVVVNMLMMGFERVPDSVRLDYPTALWWFAFSLSTLSGSAPQARPEAGSGEPEAGSL